jgi:hypothetical protein
MLPEYLLELACHVRDGIFKGNTIQTVTIFLDFFFDSSVYLFRLGQGLVPGGFRTRSKPCCLSQVTGLQGVLVPQVCHQGALGCF